MEEFVMIQVGDHMSSPVLSINPDAYAFDAVGEMYQKNVGTFLVEANGEYVGIFTKTDWIHKFLKEAGNHDAIKVSEMMTAPIITVERDEPIAKASELMKENNIRHIAVTDKGKIVGIVSVKDLEECWTNWQ
jgi:CBS domain-containing protein